mmetsp:Transcript_14307/g.23826  ORF Transcript_14307/g.23826 Transcript_14307/m.23826 type:complete len:1003 (-) Transcript_14307:658-3666(-)
MGGGSRTSESSADTLISQIECSEQAESAEGRFCGTSAQQEISEDISAGYATDEVLSTPPTPGRPLEEPTGTGDDLLCPGCHTKYDDPRLLPCLHTFCLRCLIQWSKDGQSATVTCPLDGKVHMLPSTGVAGFQPDVMTGDLLAMNNVLAGQQIIRCNSCRNCREQKAIFRCWTCQMYLCNRAVEMHREFAATCEHELQAFDVASCDAKEIRTALMEIRSSHCATHADQSLECFCETCEVPICAKCLLGAHVGHPYKTFAVVEEPLKGAISELIVGSSEWMDAVEEGIRKVDKRKEEINEQALKLDSIVREAVKCVQEALQEKEQSLVSEIESRRVQKLAGPTRQRSEFSALLSSARLSHRFASSIMKKGSVVDLLTHKAAIISRLKEIRSHQMQLEPCEAADMEVFVDADRVLEAVSDFISLQELKPLKGNSKLCDELERIKKEKDVLRSVLKAVNNELGVTRQENTALWIYRKAATEEYDELKDLKDEMHQMEKENTRLSTDLQIAQTQISDKQKESLKLNDELRDSREKVERMTKETLKLNDELRDSREKVERMTKGNSKLNYDLKKSRDDLEQMRKDFWMLTDEHEKCKDKVEQKQKENMVMQSDLQTIQKQLAESQQDNVEMRSDLQAAKRKFVESQQENKGLLSDLQTAQKQLADVKQENANLNKHVETLRRKVQRLAMEKGYQPVEVADAGENRGKHHRVVCISANGKLAAIACHQPATGVHVVQVWDAHTGTLLRTLAGHKDIIWALSFSAGGKLLASGSSDKTVRVWNVESGETVEVLKEPSDSKLSSCLYGVSLSEDGKRCVAGGSDGTVHVWNVETGEVLVEMKGHTGIVGDVAMWRDGTLAVSGGFKDNTVMIWDLISGKCTKVLQGHSGGVLAVRVSHDGGRVVSGATDKTIQVWDAGTGKSIRVIGGYSSTFTLALHSVSITWDGAYIAAPTESGKVCIWNVDSGRLCAELQQLGEKLGAASMSANGATIGAFDTTGRLKLWRMADIDE